MHVHVEAVIVREMTSEVCAFFEYERGAGVGGVNMEPAGIGWEVGGDRGRDGGEVVYGAGGRRTEGCRQVEGEEVLGFAFFEGCGQAMTGEGEVIGHVSRDGLEADASY